LKIATFIDPNSKQDRIGFIHGSKVVDLTIAYSSLLANKGEPDPYSSAESLIPPSMLNMLRGGERSIDAVKNTINYMSEIVEKNEAIAGPKGEVMVYDLDSIKIKAPVPRPGKIIHTAGNFMEHAREGSASGWAFAMPHWISFLKCPSTIIGTEDPIVYPRLTKKLDHEIELGIIIGKGGRYISEDEAWDHIAGFTIFVDVTARDIQSTEMKNGLLNLGKNLDTFAPFGPCMVLRDSIGDIHNLKIELRVNGDPRQVSNTNHLSVKINEIVSHWSVMSLEPGDIITSGTVAGVAAFRQPDPTPYWLKPGDIIESEIENIGILRNPVVEDKLTDEQELWLKKREGLFAQ